MYIMHDYDDALELILEKGFVSLNERTGEKVRTVFGLTTRYNIANNVPILTRRKVSYKAIIKELLWFTSGSVNINDLKNSGSGIWNSWIDKEFTDKHKLEEGSIGYGYGHNLINFGAKLGHKGFNQLKFVVDELKRDASSRRALFSMWRADKLDCVKLPPCHHTYQFMVSPNKKGEMKDLTCFMFQRSCDYPIGVGHGNLFQGSLFTYMIAQQLDMQPKELIHSGSHCHIYESTVPQVEEYLNRSKFPSSPCLILNKAKSIMDYREEDFVIQEYKPLTKIDFKVTV